MEDKIEGLLLNDSFVKPFKSDGTFCLVRKLWTKKRFNHKVFKSTMRLLWRVDKGLRILDINTNFFWFPFSNPNDRPRVLDANPRLFDKHVRLFQLIEEDILLSKLLFKSTSFWMR
ncbi:DUF4283 domain-containing protein [Cephalotus follicularis]|uniref:DUF4283 domain-containing protein n=1 Tax=Cephalotus follicularis TaxID=3775 RepID=A0A1Q3BK23_CEPFO|nr:DUF4283 domain-containing protein [Cephalotus follicularis]